MISFYFVNGVVVQTT